MRATVRTGEDVRTFDDKDGTRWQAAVLDASYGVILLVFSPLHGDAIRRSQLQVVNLAEGLDWIAAADEDALRAQLGVADPWDPSRDPF